MPPFENPMMMDPASMLIGAAAGVPISMAMDKLHGVEHGRIAGIAAKIDGLPGVKQASSFLETNVLSKIKGKHADDFLMRVAREKGPEAAVAQFQLHHIDDALKPFAGENAAILKKLGSAKTFEQFTASTDQKILGMLRQAQKGGQMNPRTAEKVAAILKSGEIDNKAILLAEKVVGKEAKGTLKMLAGVRARIHGLNSNYLHSFSDQALLAHKMKNVGPIGRMFGSMSNHVRGMFGGETLKKGFNSGKTKVAQTAEGAAAAESKGIMGKLFGPVMAGAITIGSALGKAKKADEGEKVKTFFHDFLGFGVGSLVGWQVGKNVLNKFNVFTRLFGKMGGFGKILAAAKPLKFLKFIPGIGPALAGIGLAGMLTEVLAITVLAEPFKRGGEWLAHRVFGKPSEATLAKIEGKPQPGGEAAPGAAAPGGLPAQQQNPGLYSQSFNRPSRFQSFKDQISGGATSATPAAAAATNPAAFSTPLDQISYSPAAAQSEAETASMMGNWSAQNSMDPFGTH